MFLGVLGMKYKHGKCLPTWKCAVYPTAFWEGACKLQKERTIPYMYIVSVIHVILLSHKSQLFISADANSKISLEQGQCVVNSLQALDHFVFPIDF